MQIRLPTGYIFGLLLSSFSLVTNAQVLAQTSSKSSKQVKVPKLDLPGRRESGGTRTPGEICISGQVPLLKLLIPETNVGFTSNSYPRFFWYAPDNTAQQVRFSLYQVDTKLRQRQLLYEKTFQPNPQSGIYSFTLPKDGKVSPLGINKNYLWSVSIICNLQDDSPKSVITSSGWVRRVGLDRRTAGKISTLTQRDRLSIYAQEGLWFDFLSTLADIRRCNPSDRNFSEQWQNTLAQVNLQSIAPEKLIDSPQQLVSCPQTTDNTSVSQTEAVNSLIERMRSLRHLRQQNKL